MKIKYYAFLKEDDEEFNISKGIYPLDLIEWDGEGKKIVEVSIHNKDGEHYDKHLAYKIGHIELLPSIEYEGIEYMRGDVIRVYEDEDENIYQDVIVEWNDKARCLTVNYDFDEFEETALYWALEIWKYYYGFEKIGNIFVNPELKENK